MDLRVEDLRVFESVALEGGFSQAASTLGMSASAVTRSIERLEAISGARLFHRTTRSVVLSAEGELLMPHARRMLAEAEAARDSLRAGEVAGLLRVTCSATFSRLYLAPVLSALTRKHPDLRFRLHLSDEQVDLVAGGFDAAVRIAPLRDSRFKALRIAPERRVVCASKSYLEERGIPEHPSELENHRCIVLGDDDLWAFKGTGAVRVPRTLEIDFGDFGRQAAEAGFGVVRLSHWHAAPSLEAGRLVRILETFEPRSHGVVAVIHTHQGLVAPRLRAFLEEVKAQLVPAPWEQ